jgi:predicted HAD superfamily hydrolase
MQSHDLLTEIEKYHFISFDIFDTALIRNVIDPVDVFRYMERKLSNETFPLPNWSELRIAAEAKARRKADSEDITLEQIYEQLNSYFPPDVIEKLKSLEIETEFSLTIANPHILKAYNKAKTLGKSVFFVSDMYLSSSCLCEILQKNGFSGNLDIFVSSETGYSKASAKMYQYIKEKVNITDPSLWLHIGDNLVSDVINANRFGIHAYHYLEVRKRSPLPDATSLEGSILRATQLNQFETGDYPYWEKFGSYYVFPIIFGFVQWLIQESKGARKLFFLSRDGYFPYKVYQKFRENDPTLPEPVYLYASRRAFQLPALLYAERDELFEILTASNGKLGQIITLAEIFENAGLDENDENLITIKKYGFKSFKDSILNEADRNRAKKVLNELYEQIIQSLRNEKELVLSYLKQEHVIDQDETIHVVDIGWRGSTQRAIQQLTGLRTQGYYFGSLPNIYDEIKKHVKSYAFHLGKPFASSHNVMDNVMMYEFIFSAPHGTVIGFQKTKSETVVPILKKVEENDVYYQSIEQIEKGIALMTNLMLPHLPIMRPLTSTEVIEGYRNFINNKYYSDLLEFTKLKGVVGIGNSQSQQCYVSTVSIEEFVNNRRKVMKKSQENLWKNAIIVQGSAEEFKKKRNNKNSAFRTVLKIFTFRRILLGLKNPVKAIRYLLHLFYK